MALLARTLGEHVLGDPGSLVGPFVEQVYDALDGAQDVDLFPGGRPDIKVFTVTLGPAPTGSSTFTYSLAVNYRRRLLLGFFRHVAQDSVIQALSVDVYGRFVDQLGFCFNTPGQTSYLLPVVYKGMTLPPISNHMDAAPGGNLLLVERNALDSRRLVATNPATLERFGDPPEAPGGYFFYRHQLPALVGWFNLGTEHFTFLGEIDDGMLELSNAWITPTTSGVELHLHVHNYSPYTLLSSGYTLKLAVYE